MYNVTVSVIVNKKTEKKAREVLKKILDDASSVVEAYHFDSITKVI